MPREDDRRPAYQQLADELRDAIAAGRYQVGDRLPSTRDLSEAHGIAMMTVRAAVGLLEDEDLVVARQGRGVFVVRTPEPPDRPETLTTVRERLDSTLKLLEQLNERLDRYEAQQAGAEPAAPGRGGDVERRISTTLDQAAEDIAAANAALDAAGPPPARPVDHHIDYQPPAPEPDRGLDIGP